MNILSSSLFRSLKKRASRLRNWLNAESQEKSTEAPKQEASSYTLVDPVPGGRKLDLLVSVSQRHLEASRNSHKHGKARWHVNHNEQVYKPKDIKLDPQLEYIYEELGLAGNIEPSALTPQKSIG